MQTVWRAIRNDTPAHTPRCVNIHGGSEDLHKGHALPGCGAHGAGFDRSGVHACLDRNVFRDGGKVRHRSWRSHDSTGSSLFAVSLRLYSNEPWQLCQVQGTRALGPLWLRRPRQLRSRHLCSSNFSRSMRPHLRGALLRPQVTTCLGTPLSMP